MLTINRAKDTVDTLLLADMSAINNRLDTFGEIHKRTVLFDNEVKKVTA